MKACKHCTSMLHSSSFCWQAPKKPVKRVRRPRRVGQGALEYRIWRNEVAVPYLDETFGHKCVRCGAISYLDVDHIKNRGSHPELKFELSNVQWLCRRCHRLKTDNLTT